MPCISKICYQVFPSDTVELINNGSLARIYILENVASTRQQRVTNMALLMPAW